MYIQEEQKYVLKSLKTRDIRIALKEAEDAYIRYKGRIANGEKIFSITAEELQKRYLEHVAGLQRDGQMSDGRARNIKTYTNHYVRFVGKKTKIQNINKKDFQGYRAFRQRDLSTIKMTVVVNESVTIKQMYRWAVKENLIHQNNFPDFGTIKIPVDDSRRDSYTNLDYKRLTEVAGKWYMKVSDQTENREEEIYYRKSIRDFIILMGHYGFRTGELLLLKNSEVIINNDGTASVTVLAETTKVRRKRTVTGRRGDIFLRRKEYSSFLEKDDYVFSHYRKSACLTRKLLYGYFNELVSEVKKKYVDFDAEKSLYSLRHLFITLHLLAGKMNVYQLARYTGTSLAQIQSHYDHLKDVDISKRIMSVNISFDKSGNLICDD